MKIVFTFLLVATLACSTLKPMEHRFSQKEKWQKSVLFQQCFQRKNAQAVNDPSGDENRLLINNPECCFKIVFPDNYEFSMCPKKADLSIAFNHFMQQKSYTFRFDNDTIDDNSIWHIIYYLQCYNTPDLTYVENTILETKKNKGQIATFLQTYDLATVLGIEPLQTWFLKSMNGSFSSYENIKIKNNAFENCDPIQNLIAFSNKKNSSDTTFNQKPFLIDRSRTMRNIVCNAPQNCIAMMYDNDLIKIYYFTNNKHRSADLHIPSLKLHRTELNTFKKDIEFEDDLLETSDDAKNNFAVQFNNDGTILLVQTTDALHMYTAKTMDFDGKKETIFCFKKTIRTGESGISSCFFTDKELISISSKGKGTIFDPSTFEKKSELDFLEPSRPQSPIYNAYTNSFFMLLENECAGYTQVTTDHGSVWKKTFSQKINSGEETNMIVHPRGDRLILATASTITLCDTENNRITKAIYHKDQQNMPCIAFSVTGALCAMIDNDVCSVYATKDLWGKRYFEAEFEFPVKKSVSHIRFNNNGGYLIVVDDDEFSIYSTSTKELFRKINIKCFAGATIRFCDDLFIISCAGTNCTPLAIYHLDCFTKQ